MIDLFAGCGGLSLGFEQAGFETLLVNEINKNARDTYILNRPKGSYEVSEDVNDLSDKQLRHYLKKWKEQGIDNVDVVCGGPPCQGYSGIGHRRSFDITKEEIPSNHLYGQMARVIKVVKPKVFLFENVKGLLSGRWTPKGTKGEIFQDVLKELSSIPNYEVEWSLVYAKDFGVPQNRPRVLVVGIRKDLYKKVPWGKYKPENYRPKNIDENAQLKGMLPIGDSKPPTVPEILGDLVDGNYLRGETTQYLSDAKNSVQTSLRKKGRKVAAKGDPLTEQQYGKHASHIVEKFRYMIENNGEIPTSMQTKKFAQRVLPKKWKESGPNITATSLPDDYVHYKQPRVPTVREWARLQTFPDWYQFAGPRTTGGRRRAGDPDAGLWDRDVPKYTQIGNAVPVFLANSVGKHIKSIIGHGTPKKNSQSREDKNGRFGVLT